ncbi:1-phosphofructokinase [Aquibacillus sp. 3ASR75-11]|uniref:Tagatose-6-phosphate kinase n=1 Tax=Terrihalobacillus insolitus TaxID=2950438 RepID=A0A9X3WNL6_9BACI|nr:1-phosphofructokinase [Terrihalobacillus insolitus]MDC3411988.1 1-phosphofructokinase [Terrihalobacillus insolitus]MDC3423327.1 1-phosphofructokinase [Terrihalobacillus insolitus]
MQPVITITLNPAMDKTVMLPNFQLGALNRITNAVQVDPGGKGINVAKVLQQFNTKVIASGLIGGDLGKKLQKQVEKLGIATDFVEVDGEVRTNLKIVDEQTKQTTEINEPGFTVSIEDKQQIKEKISNLMDNASFLILSGSIPNEMEAEVYSNYIHLAKEKGVKTILDADGLVLKHGIDAKPFAIKPNLYELEKYIGKKLPNVEAVVEAGKRLIGRGIELVIVSMGEAGAIFLTENDGCHVKPFSITPKSTVGAGDSMVAAIAYAYGNHFSFSEMAAWATTAGTITASKSGTNVCSLKEVRDALSKVQTSQLY